VLKRSDAGAPVAATAGLQVPPPSSDRLAITAWLPIDVTPHTATHFPCPSVATSANAIPEVRGSGSIEIGTDQLAPPSCEVATRTPWAVEVHTVTRVLPSAAIRGPMSLS
jgi:hypothetical protein